MNDLSGTARRAVLLVVLTTAFLAGCDSGASPSGAPLPTITVADPDDTTLTRAAGWVPAEILDGKALVRVDSPFGPYVIFAGLAKGWDSCNRFSGPYRVDGDRLSVGPVGSTQALCAPVSGQRDPAMGFLRMLEDATHYRLTNGSLVLSDARGRTTLRLVPRTHTSPEDSYEIPGP